MESEAPPPKKAKKKVIKDWEEDEVYKLISLVENEPCLWNAGDKSYHNKILRENAWQAISNHFQSKFGPDDLNAKWTNLRIQYRGYAARAKTKSGQGATEIPKWKYFCAMDFVGRTEIQQTDPTTSNLIIELDPDNFSFDSSTSTSSPQPPLPTPAPSVSTSKRSQAVSASSAATQIAETMREAFAAMKERNQNALDPNSTFANYLLSELRTLSDDASSTVRNKLTLVFLQCVEDIRQKTP